MTTIEEARGSRRSMAFWLGCLAMFTAGLSFAIRAAIAKDLQVEFLEPIDLARSATMIGFALGAAFLGFSLMLMVSSTLLDRIGMKRMLVFAWASFMVGTAGILFCGAFDGEMSYYVMVAGMFITGFGWGAVEGTTNPLVASLYPSDTTHWMNMLHAWWPAGLIVGGLTGVFGKQLGLEWWMILLLVPIFATIFGLLVLRCEFPQTTSVSLGVNTRQQFGEILRRPTFLIWFVLMLFTAASELAPGQWVDVALTNVVGIRGVLLLVYVAGIQFIGRHFAGPMAHRLTPEGLLCVSSLLAALGLLGLAHANSPATALGAATLWGFGVCYLWPTMLAVVAERYPRGGALTIGLMGVAGSLSTYFVLPVLGGIYDAAKIEAAGGVEALAAMTPDQLQPVLIFAATESFKAVSVIPALLVVAFAILWVLHGRKKAG